MNKVVLVGRLTAKPELRYTASNTAYTRFSVAVNRPFANADGKRDADFINVVAWRKQAETISKFFDKGKILPRRITGACAKHQRHIAEQVKYARLMALIPFVK